MPSWTDNAIVLSSSSHGEGGLVVQLFTREQGRFAGLVRGTKKYAPICQPGNMVNATWNARLEEQLGRFSVLETERSLAPLLSSDRQRLLAFSSACAMVYQFLPERDAHPRLYDVLAELLSSMQAPGTHWVLDYIAFELMLLQELGHGLQLDNCADTGTSEALAYVSPKSGAAVCESSAAPYKERLLPLPKMLTPDCPKNHAPNHAEIVDGLRLCGYFLEHHMAQDLHMKLPDARDSWVSYLQQEALCA